MKLVDANVLLYAVNRDAHHHLAARGWLDEALVRREPVGFAWIALLAFVRLSTNRPFPRPLTSHQATDLAREWLEQPATVVLEPTARHLGLVSSLLAEAGTACNLVTDAHLAALALEHDATIVSYDRDFGRFAGVRWEQPAP